MNDYSSIVPGIELEFSGGSFMFVFYLLYALLTMGVSVASYVFQALGLYTIAKRRGIRKPWLSWVPVGNMWILGSISDQYQYVVKGKVRNKRKVLLMLNILAYVAAFSVIIAAAVTIGIGLSELPQTIITTVLGSIVIVIVAWISMAALSVALTVITYIVLYDLYRSCEPDNSILYLLLSIFVNIAQPIIIFICRNKELGMPPRKQEPSAFIPPDPVEIPPWRPAQNTEDPWNNPEE